MLGSKRMGLTPGCYYSLTSIEKTTEMIPLGQQITRKQTSLLDGPSREKCPFFSAIAAQDIGL